MITLEKYLKNSSGFLDEEIEMMRKLPLEPENFSIDGKKEILFENITKFFTQIGCHFSDSILGATLHIKRGELLIGILSFEPLESLDLTYVKVTPLPECFSEL